MLIGSPQQPECFLEVHLKLGYVGVEFLDSQLRVETNYQFVKSDNGKLFLKTAISRSFDKNTAEIMQAEKYYFSPSGSVRIELDDRVKDIVESAEKDIDVTHNWEDIPEFGHYVSISQRERDFAH